MALHLHRAWRTDRLADDLGTLLATPLPDPFAEEVVVVPARGVERWLTQRLSHRLGVGPRGGDGICAGVRFLQPATLVGLLLGRDADDPWHPDRLVWPLLETIDEHLDEPWCVTLATHLGHGLDGEEGELRRSRRWAVSRRLAGLFASYAVQRPRLVADWREGRDTDGIGGALPPDLRWQAELWRRLLERMGGEAPDQRHRRVCDRLRGGGDTGAPDGLELPGRLSLFGHTRLPATEIELLGALAEHRDVHLWLAQPSAALWDAVAGAARATGGSRADDATAGLVAHPLLASLGRDSRELAQALTAPGPTTVDTPVAAEAPLPPTLLGWLQSDLRANRAPSAEEVAARVLAPGDRSVQVHACHGAARQVDVLREVLVGLLADDPTLEPRDIVVMCPDIETYAPLISAGFGLAEIVGDGVAVHPAHGLRVRLADRSAASTNPLLAVAVTLVELAGGRVTASDVVDLLARDPVRRRFDLTDDELARIARWVADAGVRWGLDGPHRAAFRMEGFTQNTWRAGLDRLLLGVAMGGDEHRHLGRGLPVDDIGSGEIDLVGRLAEAVDRLADCLDGLGRATRAGEWFSTLAEGVRGLCDVDVDDAWQLPQFERELARARAGADASGQGADVPLRLADVRALLAARLAGRPTRANFRSGTLTVCTMVPMRSVPHRVVCLVGLDDGVFPRHPTVDGDDVLARDPQVGERDPRSEDRQLLLDAILAAQERLVITYAGAGEHTGQERPPSVPLGEVLDALDRTATPATGAASGAASVREEILVRHPLQPYDPRNHAAGALVADRPFSFDRATLGGARAAVGPRRPEAPFLADPLPAVPSGDLTLSELKEFLVKPVRTFLRRRLVVATPFEPDDIADAIPISLNGLEVWQIGDRLLREVLAAEDPAATAQAVMLAEQLRGTLPPAGLGQRALGNVVEECQQLFAATAALRQGAPRSLDVDVDLGDGRRLTGTVPRVYGNQVVTLSYSRLKPKQRLEAWVDVLALSAAYPDENWTAHAVARERSGPKRALTGPLDHRATEWLRGLVALHDEGMTRPLPLPVGTAATWAEAHQRTLWGDPVDVRAAARKVWVTDPHNAYGIEGEDAEPAHRLAFGAGAGLDTLLDLGLADVAWRLWEPLLAGAEKVGPL
ncbi:exodeoxyribonuclease V subunit gamma [Nocardioides sp. GY 10113]|uniref:exodeoxyribonuclease V subunit gamma n=1 Tax=Nocardioides sp. GY 10113 TaxID=2569761 RepID=UPI0010A8BC8D|nr:exodeoxyribonuclease V subunit gamma [Nocardioides sp. GY 10113]TIC85046.1 exodeoxyribonuclease V subunit gamma [Nocardioides sp. GY 10113]